MEKGVREALTEVLVQQSGITPAEAEETIDRLQQQGRYQRDTY